eukprot:485914-Amorphochlora_amoeboformis.AAC.1
MVRFRIGPMSHKTSESARGSGGTGGTGARRILTSKALSGTGRSTLRPQLNPNALPFNPTKNRIVILNSRGADIKLLCRMI